MLKNIMRGDVNQLNDRRSVAVFVSLGGALTIVYASVAMLHEYDARPTIAMMGPLLSFTLYLAAVGVANRLSGRTVLASAALFGATFRLLMLPEAPFFSDDFFRYLWDGLVQRHGINPYQFAPSDSELAGIDDALRAQVNHPTVLTIYPPLAQVVFFLNAILSGGLLGLKIVWLACDVGIAALLYRLVPDRHRLQMWILYWWSPLVVFEVAWNAHLDLLGVLPMILALWLARYGRSHLFALGFSIASAALVKYFAAALLPSAARENRSPRVLAAFSAAALVLYLPYAGAGTHLFGGLAMFAEHWRFNDSLFVLIAWLAPSSLVARAIAAAAVFLVVVQSVRNEWTLERTAFWVVGAILLLSPTVHPWYLIWMVPLVAIRFNRAWLYLTGSIFLAYYGLETYREIGVWPEPWWVKLAIYGPFFAILFADAWRGSWVQSAVEQVRSRD
jgi:hypothetical protein